MNHLPITPVDVLPIGLRRDMSYREAFHLAAKERAQRELAVPLYLLPKPKPQPEKILPPPPPPIDLLQLEHDAACAHAAEIEAQLGRVTIQKVQASCAKYYDLPLDLLLNPHLLRRPTMCRQVCLYLALALTRRSLPAIGRAFNTHHTNVLHAARKIGKLCETNYTMRNEIEDLKALIGVECSILPILEEHRRDD